MPSQCCVWRGRSTPAAVLARFARFRVFTEEKSVAVMNHTGKVFEFSSRGLAVSEVCPGKLTGRMKRRK